MDALAEAGRALAELKPIASPGAVPVLEVDRLWQVLVGASAEILNATRATRHAEARYRSIVNTAVDAMVVIDETGTVQSFNKAAERIFGYTADKVLGCNVRVLMPEPDRGGHDGYLTRYRQTGERKIIGIGREVRGQRQDGSTFPLELAIAEWHADGQRFFTGIMRDITARKDAEQGLRESQAAMQAAKEEAERANLAKSKFLAAASHDLRQPLQSLFFVSNALARHVQNERGRDLLVRLGQGLHALKDLLDSLLDMSKLDAGVIRPQLAAVPLGPLVEEIVASYMPIAAGKGLILSATPSCDLVVYTDRTLLGRIVRNLVENAIRYTAQGKSISAATGPGTASESTSPTLVSAFRPSIWSGFGRNSTRSATRSATAAKARVGPRHRAAPGAPTRPRGRGPLKARGRLGVLSPGACGEGGRTAGADRCPRG
jgi:PAS domain S-box-containing protein